MNSMIQQPTNCIRPNTMIRRCLVLVWMLLPMCVWGQSPPDTLLPDLTPREVEILGELNIDFPNVARKPLVGFNPPPRIYVVPQDRRPFVEHYKQEAANLPTSALRQPGTIGIGQGLQAVPHTLMITLGAGRYLGRLAQLEATRKLGANTGIHARMDYAGQSTFKPYVDKGTAQDTLKAPNDRISGSIGLQTTQGTVAFGIEGRGFYDKYEIYAVNLGVPNVSPAPERIGQGIESRLWSQGVIGKIPFSISMRYGGTRYDTQTAEGVVDPRLIRTERRMDVKGRTGYHAQVFQFEVEGALTTGGLDTDGLLDQDHVAYAVAPFISMRFDDFARLQIGARMLGYSASARNVAPGQVAEERSASHIAPLARLDLFLKPTIQLYVQNDPKREVHGLSDVHRLNPYVINEPELKPNLSTIDTEGGAILYTGPLRLSGFGGVQRFQEYLFFEEAPHLGFAGGFFEARYEKANITYAGADVALALPGRLSASLGVTWRDGSLQDPQTDIPYFSALVGQGRMAYRFLEQKGLIQVNGTWQGQRFTDRAGTVELDAFLDVDVEGTYFIRPRWAIYSRINNITTQRFAHWNGYPTPPMEALVGVRLRW